MGQDDIARLSSFFGMPGWLVMLMFLLLMLATWETGHWLGLKSRIDEKTKSAIPTVAGAILGVLGLLLAFTMSMAVTRYDTRRHLVLEEANAIRTAYLRTQLLPRPESTELQDLLRQYAEVRLRIAQAGRDAQTLQQGREEAEQLQRQLWSRAAAFAEKEQRSVTARLLLRSLNNMFDLKTGRWVAFIGRVPENVIYVNAVIGLLAALMLGYGFGMAGRHRPLYEALLIVSVTLVLAVIINLDDPRSRAIRDSQQPMIDLQGQLVKPKC